jgi:hypothetical protein
MRSRPDSRPTTGPTAHEPPSRKQAETLTTGPGVPAPEMPRLAAEQERVEDTRWRTGGRRVEEEERELERPQQQSRLQEQPRQQ